MNSTIRTSRRRVLSGATTGDPVSSVRIFGGRYSHHARNSGYEGFNRILHLPTIGDLSSRISSGRWGSKLDRVMARMSGRRLYSIKLFLNELVTAAHMVCQKGVLYHALYADTDVHILGRIASATGNKLAVTFHEPPGGLEYLKISKELLSTVSAVILVCEAQRSYFESMVPPDRIFVVPHGIDTSFFSRSSPLNKEPVCITVGNHYRDFAMLGRAMSRVWSQRSDVRFIAVGIGRPSDLCSAGQDPRIQYLDGIDDCELLATYHRARVALLPLKAATASNALLEAMACGLPIITTRCGGTAEYIGEDGGVMIPPSDPDQFAAAILKLVPADSSAEAIGENARKRVRKFDYAVVARQMKAVYEAVLDTPLRT